MNMPSIGETSLMIASIGISASPTVSILEKIAKGHSNRIKIPKAKSPPTNPPHAASFSFFSDPPITMVIEAPTAMLNDT